MKVLVLGSGSWAMALAWVLRSKGFAVTLWCRREERAAEIRRGKHSLLPGVDLGTGYECAVGTDSLGEGYDFGLSVVPTQHLRGTLQGLGSRLPRDIPWLSASKGLERGKMRLPSQILSEEGCVDVGILSGPSPCRRGGEGGTDGGRLGARVRRDRAAVAGGSFPPVASASTRVQIPPASSGGAF